MLGWLFGWFEDETVQVEPEQKPRKPETVQQIWDEAFSFKTPARKPQKPETERPKLKKNWDREIAKLEAEIARHERHMAATGLTSYQADKLFEANPGLYDQVEASLSLDGKLPDDLWTALASSYETAIANNDLDLATYAMDASADYVSAVGSAIAAVEERRANYAFQASGWTDGFRSQLAKQGRRWDKRDKLGRFCH